MLGNRDALGAIVEFTDFQCSFCASYFHDTYGQIVNEYVKTGKVRYISRNFPLEQPHPLAEKAAEAGLCAADQGRYWEARDRFFSNQKALAVADMNDHAAALGLNLPSFRQCLESGKYKAAVDLDVAEGKDLGIRGTPSFFIGYADPGDPSRIQAVKLLVGNLAFRDFKRAIDEVLVQAKRNDCSNGAATTRRYLSTAVIAKRLGLARRTICLWAECGEIPAVKCGRQWRFEEGKFSEWLLAKERASGYPIETQHSEDEDLILSPSFTRRDHPL